MAIIQLLTALSFIGAVLCSSLEIHHHMTPEERQQIFYTTGIDVPPYEVVKIHSSRMGKREVNVGHVIELNAYGDNVKSWITPTEGILAGDSTPILGVRSQRNGGIYLHKYKNKMKELAATLYKNNDHGITMTVNYAANGARMMNGIIGNKNLYVKPVPDRLTNSINRYRRSVGKVESDYEEQSYHIVYKIPVTSHNTTLMSPLTQSRRTKRNAPIPSIIYPQVLVIVDFGLYRQLGGTIESAVPYLLSFWNGVDMKYSTLKNPQYKLNIAAIFLAEDQYALSFLQTCKRYRTNQIDGRSVIEQAAQWLREYKGVIPPEQYDVAVIMTKQNLAVTKNGFLSPELGHAWIAGACDLYSYWGYQRSGVVHDDGTFGGIHAAAHELGHLLGANHDGIENPNCATNAGNIMADHPILNTDNSYIWSRCSQWDFKLFFRYHNPTCLYNKPHPGSEISKILPGKMIDANRQCLIINRNAKAWITPNICRKLICYDSTRYYNNIDWSAADGTYCAPGKMCLYGRCVNES